MLNRNSVRGHSRVRALVAALLGTGALAAYLPLASAADAAKSDAKSDDQVLEEVQVTGSRIKHTTDYTTAVPTTVIDVKTMEDAGIVNVGDVLALTPSNISAFTPTTTGGSSFNTGAYVPDLRGLNPFFGSRTLTLIDTQRPVSTSTLDSFDLNMIPSALVSRIDSVTGGGSASYGSGAVSGAINIILNHYLEGGKFDVDHYAAIPENDAKSDHVALAYGHGFADDRFHVVLGGEYQKSGAASCMESAREWCQRSYGPYQTSTVVASGYGTAATAIQSVGTGLTTNVNAFGVYAPAAFNTSTFGGYTLTTHDFASTNAAGNAPAAFNANSSIYLSTAPGGDGTLVNQYTNLATAVKRKILTGLFSFKVTDDIKGHLDLNYGKVNAVNPDSAFQINTGTILGFDNPYLQAATGKSQSQLFSAAQTSAGCSPTVPTNTNCSPGYAVAKDWNSQIPDVQFNDTTVKQASLGFEGKLPYTTSWSWDAHALVGKTDNVQGSYHEPTVLKYSMAQDATASGCRVNLGLANAYTSAQANYAQGGAGVFGGIGAGSGLPLWARLYNAVNNGIDQISPVTGLLESQTLALLASRCQPLNPFGNAAVSATARDYSTGPLSLALVQKVTSFNLNTSGDIFSGVGAGAFSLAVGYDYHKEKTDNEFAACPGAHNTLGNANLTADQRECLAIATDFAYQFGNDYGGSSTFNEVYAELSLPLLKGVPGANLLSADLAGRESWYENKAAYGVNIVPGAKGTGSLPTWKASLVYEPVSGVRFRGSESHDSRAPNPRDLYYSQTFVPGGPFGGFCYSADFLTSSPVCFVNLVGNVDLKPETSNTTALGLVFTPADAGIDSLRGFQASADWFHVKIKDAIQGGGLSNLFGCIAGGSCSTIKFNNYYYEKNPAAGSPRRVSQTAPTDYVAVTGIDAYRLGNVTNIIGDDEPAYNGGVTDETGVDFSVSYGTDLPDGSKLNIRSLTTLVTKQLVQADKNGVVQDAKGAIGGSGSLFLANFVPAAKLRGNVYVTWTKGNFDVTPNVSWVGTGTISNSALACTPSNFADVTNKCNWVANGYYAGTAGQTAEQKAAQLTAYTLLPQGVQNHVGAYFLFGLNAAYKIQNVPGVKSLQIWGQVNNLLDRDPPFVNSTTTAASFYDQLGRAYRVGFRMSF